MGVTLTEATDLGQIDPWRCGQLDGATTAGDLRMVIGGGGRGRMDLRGRRKEGLGATVMGGSGAGGDGEGLVWRCGRWGRGVFWNEKGAPGASNLAGHAAVTKFS